MHFNIKNDYVYVEGVSDKATLDLIRKTCSYAIPNANYSPKYQVGSWDGTISLFHNRNKTFPTGILESVIQACKKANISFEINDLRNKPSTNRQYFCDLGEHSFRDYQQIAIEKVSSETRGILAMCTGAGKTKTSCGIISYLSVYPVIFVVPSVALLKQTAQEFRTSLKNMDGTAIQVGELGGGVCDIVPYGVNVATYHTLLTAFDKKYSDKQKKIVTNEDDGTIIFKDLEKELQRLNVDLTNSPPNKTAKIKKNIQKVQKKINDQTKIFQNKADIRFLVEMCQLLFIDETHIAAEVIECISLHSKNAYYKVGLSGTPKRLDNQDLRMFGATGHIIHEVSSSELIRRGFLVRPYIHVIDLNFMDNTGVTWQETYKKAIETNEARNSLIAQLATMTHSQGRPTLIFVERLDHGKTLESMIPNALFVPGGDGSDDKPISDEELDYRKYQLNRLEKNDIIMITTSWAYTGIDAPKISALILACSIASPNTVTQQIGRVLRKSEGKENCVIFDFKMKESNLRNQFYSRLEMYKSEEEFRILNYKYKPGKGFFLVD